MGVDQAGEYELVAQVDDLGAGVTRGVNESIANRLNLAIAYQDRRGVTWRLSGAIEQTPRMHDDDTIRFRLRRDAGSCESQRQQTR